MEGKVLAAVFGGGSGTVADGQMEKRADVASPLSENWIDIDFSIDLY